MHQAADAVLSSARCTLLEFTNKAQFLFQNQEASAKRRLLNFVLSKPLLKRGHSGLSFPIIGRSHQQPDPRHALSQLRPLSERECNGLAA
jgi:hypothetical protein